jgi:phage terminase small subunit
VKDTLNDRQRAFVRHYRECGNATEAYRRAGYDARGNSAEVNAHRLLRSPKVAKELARYEAKAERKSIATVDECFELWTALMRDDAIEPKDRIKASELRAKAAGAFIERREITGANGGALEVRFSIDAAAAGARDGSLPKGGDSDDDDGD